MVPQSVNDYRLLAKANLDPHLWRYLSDGDSYRNERALSRVSIMPRPLCDLSGGHTTLNLFGQRMDHPFLLAPIAYQRLFHPNGERESALAAGAQGGQLLVSSLASQPFAEIFQIARQEYEAGPWFQFYWQGDRERSLRLLNQALAAGCSAIVFTVDAPLKLATLDLPNEIYAVNIEPSKKRLVEGSKIFNGWMSQAPTWNDVAWLIQQTTLPILIKGILHPDDAAQAVELGCDGLIVSNHGGRVLSKAPSAFSALPSVVARVNGRVPVLFDSGIRSGQDAFVALACGATAVLVGRPYLWGLTTNGAMGVAHVIRLLRDELEMAMALAGCRTLSEIGASCITR